VVVVVAPFVVAEATSVFVVIVVVVVAPFVVAEATSVVVLVMLVVVVVVEVVFVLVVFVVVPSDTPCWQFIQPTEGIHVETHGKTGQEACNGTKHHGKTFGSPSP
jgi:hypothetical protein